MTNRSSKWTRHSQKMVCLLAACGLIYACKDEYKLDDEKPGYLNTSIFESLQHPKDELKGKTFNTYMRLLADKDVNTGDRDLTDVLSRTGSKTVFVSDDEGWNAFFEKNKTLPEKNPWHYATSFETLSEAQKKLLIHTSMLNNAIVMENLASSEAQGSNSPTRGEYMRRYTDVESTDSITYVPSEDIPVSYSPYDKDYWARFRQENGGKGIFMVADSTVSMMLHFTSEHLTKNNVTDEDFKIIMGEERRTSDVHIYNSKLGSKDIVCQNGYVNVTDKPIAPLASMAEVIRTNGKTDIFSHMLDRYSAPFYCKRITDLYKDLHPSFTDSIFNKRYFSDNSYGHKALAAEPGPNGTYLSYMPYKEDTPKEIQDIIPSLKFDPGWNGYYDEVAAEKDMAAMFVPSDSALMEYFTKGGGRQLVRTYYLNEKDDGTTDRPDFTPTTKDELYQQIDYIPLGTLQSLIRIIMMRSFVGSVPSKMTKLRDDAQEQLFYPEDRDKIENCELASNGVVYIMKDIYGPADYTSVTSPAYISTTNKIMKWAIYNGSKPDENEMGLNYYAYLKAMQSEFTFFLPSDVALRHYYDPTSMKSRTPRYVNFNYVTKKFPVEAKSYTYVSPYTAKGDPSKIGPNDTAYPNTTGKVEQTDITNRLKDILESHTIVHDQYNPINGEDEYFLSKNGNAIKVVRDENHKIIEVKGGFQLENERNGVENETEGVKTCKVTKPFEDLKNGQTYVLDAPLVPTYRSVWSILTDDMMEPAASGYNPKGYTEENWENNPYHAFYDLCKDDSAEIIIMRCGLVDMKLSANEQKSSMKKFRIFTDAEKGLDQNIQFFNNYRYTIFVPTNEAIADAIAHGLPTWDEIKADYLASRKPLYEEDGVTPVLDADGNQDYSEDIATEEDSLRLQAKITYLTNFIRNHFADNSVFVDKTELADNEMVTSSYDKQNGLFCKIHVDRKKIGDKTVLRVCDATKKNADLGWADKHEVLDVITINGEEKDVKNVLARDVSCSSSPRGVAMTNIRLDASSAAVIHLLNGTLNHTDLKKDSEGNEIHNVWNTPSECRKYLKRYGL